MRSKNPVYEKEMWAANRSKPFAASLMGVNVVMAVIALAVFTNVLAFLETNGHSNYSSMLQMYIIMGVSECLLIIAVLPGMAGAGIAQEKERGTLELMLVSGIRPYQIVTGKMAAYLSTIIVLIVSGFPALSLVFVYGGIQVRDLLWVAAVLTILSVYLCAAALFGSALVKKMGHAVVIAYAIILIIVGGTLLIHYIPMLLFGISYGAQIGSRIAWYHYLLLFNPLVTLYTVLNQQAGSREFLFDLINYEGNYRPNWVTENWVSLSLLLQLFCTVVFVAITIKLVNRKK